ncbi:uncharacterized protein NECHADRAFT_83370 [Fusarium vanettenii 77-13-4]|uniref:Heterokaryon incompatibility domain-containing protein n=1 Tax=Fusarium vanettenii (strain ATCC MYA-4622 / CBS 123669 / FGSC 9596 / NRRL 45880 / 77-13-4) TaxID=660122 RepID=C7Z3U4_FUSV7|nr:uncharacterized protein NECHADRAFT_83370 [Fusarium vanettenii 77-13-4]EEU41198.1 hypothetical protein NECHADRAFT_83370 [Fusarium vanettenii 77-13-4]
MTDPLCPRCQSLDLSVAKFRIENTRAGEENCFPPLIEFAPSHYVLGTMAQIRLKSCEAYIILAAPSKYDKSDVDYPGLLNDETQFLGRRIGSNHNKRNLIREFLRLCERFHDDRCTRKLGIEDPFQETLNEPYFGVIDIENENLVPLPFSQSGRLLCFEPYATVSYVWGTKHSRQHATRISTIQSRRKSGGLSAVIRELPKALRESIDLVRGLGIRYMWIDALCIVQDSSHSWNLNARAMHLIYGNSTITICAADGEDASTGLLALDNNHRPPQMIVNYDEGVCLILHWPSETSIKTTRWNQRAWTFQERLLSKRCLIFTEGRIFFQCRSTGMSEDVFSDKDGKGWSLDLVRAPLQLLSQLKVRAFWFYAHCVTLYTARELYEPFDILAAFGGMCRLMENTMQAPFVFGLPTSHFDLAILWQPVAKSERLNRATVSDDPKYKDMRFPSWSWCGWNHQGATYDWEMVGGCFADVRTWILNHTWIDWYIRDGYGTLRRVWDRRYAKEDESDDGRWRGYKITEASNQEHKASDDKHNGETTTTKDRDEKMTNRYLPRAPKRICMDLQDIVSSLTSANRQTANTLHTPTCREGAAGLISTPPLFPSEADAFGRPYIGRSTRSFVMKEFTLTLPEDPFNVLTRETSQGSISSRSVEEFPDQPFLQFFTWRAKFHVTSLAESQYAPEQPLKEGREAEGEGPLCRCDIIDRRGDKCGSVVVDTKWLRGKEKVHETLFEFIAISDAKQFTEKEFPDWTYYIPKERIESEWDLYYVLLVESIPEEGIYRRVALGKVFKAAFTHSKNEWKEIILG